MARKDIKDMSSTQQSHNTSWWESGPSVSGSISPCTVCRGSVLLLTRLSLMLVTTSLLWSFCYLAFFLRLLACSSAPPCPDALPEAPAQLHSRPSVSSSALPPQSLVSSCSSSGQELLGASRAPSPPAWQQTVLKALLLCQGTGTDGFHRQGTAPPSPCSPLNLPEEHQQWWEAANSKGRPVDWDILDPRHLLPMGHLFSRQSRFSHRQRVSLTSPWAGSSVLQWEAEVGDHGGQFTSLSAEAMQEAGTCLSYANAQAETESILKNHIYNNGPHLSLIQVSVSSFPHTHNFLCVVTAEIIIFALQMPQRKATNAVYSYSMFLFLLAEFRYFSAIRFQRVNLLWYVKKIK